MHLKNITSERVHSQACPVETDACADLLDSVFQSDAPLRNCNLAELMRQVPQFSIRELPSAIGQLNRMKRADDTNLVAEILKRFSLTLQAAFTDVFNSCFDQGKLD